MFDNPQVQNEIEAYLLGLLYADGCIEGKRYEKYYTLGITLSEKDKIFLQKILNIFNTELNKNYDLKYSANTKSYKITICNVQLINNLINLGIIPQKTYSNNDFVFTNVPDNLKRHFIRGYFDGDGTIGIYKNKAQIGFVSLNQKLLNSILNYIHSQIINKGTIRTDTKYYRLYISGNPSCKCFLNYLYNESTIYLERKYLIYKEIKLQPYRKYQNIYLQKENMYVVRIRNEYIGVRHTIKEAVELYNQYCEQYNLPKQNYKGENLK